jgi:ring-1,2-phenylacetyl-CoA epoxidase subunit PaaD
MPAPGERSMCGAELKTREQAAWDALAAVPDPELPALGIVDLGIVRTVERDADGSLVVALTPTYSGCPATAWIEAEVGRALAAAGLEPFRIEQRLAPAWSSDWISPAGRAKLEAYRIVPPGAAAPADRGMAVLHFHPPALACPHCGSRDTERLAAFGSTACKALHRCRACGEPFEHFKPI